MSTINNHKIPGDLDIVGALKKNGVTIDTDDIVFSNTTTISIGSLAGESNQGANSIILNATGVALDSTTASSFHVKPVRGGNFAASALAYTADGEIVEETGTHFDASGNVGIGTTDPVSILDVYNNPSDETRSVFKIRDAVTNLNFRVGLKAGTGGYTSGWTNIDPNGGASSGVSIFDALDIQGTLSVSSTKNFVIDHPLQPTLKKLTHVAIESPRVDLMYRGTTQLKDGKAIVNIDKECVGDESCVMEDGTFEALCRDPVYYLQNTSDFSRLIGNVDGSTLTIISEDVNSNANVNWMVVAERKDRNILESRDTTDDGRLITETDDTSERVNKDGSKRYPSV